MTRADNTWPLARAAASRHQATLTKASNTIERLDRSGQPVTFSAVAAAAGVSRTWLYRNPSIRDLITRLRTEPSQPASTPAAQRATAESLRARLDAARQALSVRDHPPASRERHAPRTSSPPPRPAARPGTPHPARHQPATLTRPPTRRTSRQLHVNNAETLSHQGFSRTG